MGMLETGECQPEVIEPMRQGDAGNRDAERARVGEVRQAKGKRVLSLIAGPLGKLKAAKPGVGALGGDLAARNALEGVRGVNAAFSRSVPIDDKRVKNSQSVAVGQPTVGKTGIRLSPVGTPTGRLPVSSCLVRRIMGVNRHGRLQGGCSCLRGSAGG
jgi:hypothetical protein